MLSNLTFGGLITTLCSVPADEIEIILIFVLSEMGRWLHGGRNHRGRHGDWIIYLMIFYLVKNHFISLTDLDCIKLSTGAYTIVISLMSKHSK